LVFIRINIDRTVKGIHLMIPAEVGPRSMGEGFFWNRTSIEANPFNALWENTAGKTDFPLIANHPASK
jgi:hypothetical protein